jgi:ElaB/YqjD/DUF883 family membrane-anchored ribosome-binding protein
MESTTHDKPHQSTSSAIHTASRELNSAADKAADTARQVGDQFSEAAAEKLGQAKQKVGEVYDQVNKTVNEQYTKAVGYSRENPGKTTLIALGIGVGIGLLIGGNARSSRRSRGRIVEPVINALSTLATEIFA